jgi:hypothetical protein
MFIHPPHCTIHLLFLSRYSVIHLNPTLSIPSRIHLTHLRTLQTQGKIHHLGMTNTDLPHLKLLKASGFPIVSNQISVSVLDRRVETRGMGKWCLENGVGILAYGTLLGGFLGEKWVGVEEPKELENWSLKKYKRFIDAAGECFITWSPYPIHRCTLDSVIAPRVTYRALPFFPSITATSNRVTCALLYCLCLC